MKRLILGGLSVLLLSTAAPIVKAQTTALNPTTLNSTSRTQLTPFNLVFLAHRGYFQDQNIPSYNLFTAAYHQGKITAEDIVQAAVEANRLSPELLTNQRYLNSVEAQLRSLENIR